MKVITEFLGTFFFLFVIALIAVTGSLFTPLVIGAALVVVVYMGGHVSGAHYNPAVTLALLLKKKCSAVEAGAYVAAQVIAGLAAFMLAYYLTGTTPGIAPGSGVEALKAVIVEVIFTTMLCLVVLNVATAKANAGNSFYGIAIGFTIVAAAFAGGPISGGAFNPAVGISATVTKALFQSGEWTHLWIYLVGPFIGALLAAAVYGIQNPELATAE